VCVCRTRLSHFQALLNVCRSLLNICMAHLSVHCSLSIVRKTHLREF